VALTCALTIDLSARARCRPPSPPLPLGTNLLHHVFKHLPLVILQLAVLGRVANVELVLGLGLGRLERARQDAACTGVATPSQSPVPP
jgi:hypothetical protein